MLELYTWNTPNGIKPVIMLEEIELPYILKPVNIGKDEQFSPEFLRISPNNKIPALLDAGAAAGPLSLFESGAILVYLADQTVKLLPPSGPDRYRVLEWVFWQVGGTGPNVANYNFFAKRSEEKSDLAIERFRKETVRLLKVLNGQLDKHAFAGGPDYSIADIMNYGWAKSAVALVKELTPDALPDIESVERWLGSVAQRPAVKRAYEKLEAIPK